MACTCLGHAVWLEGAWIADRASWVGALDRTPSRAEVRVEGLFPGDRIPRADRVTQLGAMVLARALEGVAPRDGTDTSVITASTLATAHTNERFELRRIDGRAPEPRAFPYTAPNAAAGEFAIATRSHGPTLALVGDGGVAWTAVHRAASWLTHGRCARALVVVTECLPAFPDRVAPRGVVPREGAVAVVLERAGRAEATRWTMAWHTGAHADATAVSSSLSVGPLAEVTFATSGHFVFANGAGSALSVDVVGAR